jgi:hypothetical protein
MRENDNNVKAIIHQSELEFITRWILEYPNLETGGDFFGYWDENGIPIVEFVIGPGRKARRTSTSFFQDIDYLKTWGKLVNGMDNRLTHIGAWHSHHQLNLATPSLGDINTMRNALSGDGLSKFLISIGNIDKKLEVKINGFLFVKDLPQDYLHCSWEIKNGLSPIRQMLNSDPDLVSTESQPIKQQAVNSEQPKIEKTEVRQRDIKVDVEKPVLEDNSYWLKPEGRKFLKSAFENISKAQFVRNVEILQLADSRIVLAFSYLGRSIRITFSENFPSTSPTVTMKQPADVFSILGSFFRKNDDRLEKRICEIIASAGIVEAGMIKIKNI